MEGKTINAKQELLDTLKQINKETSEIKCAITSIFVVDKDYTQNGWDSPEGEQKRLILKVGYNQQELENFLEGLNVEYDNGFNHQYLAGRILFEDETWLERATYDGSEWWEYRAYAIPKECQY